MENEDEALRACSRNLLKTLNPDGKNEQQIEEVLRNIAKVQSGSSGKSASENELHLQNVMKKLLRCKSGKGIEESDLHKLNTRFQSGKLPRLKNVGPPDTNQTRFTSYQPQSQEKGVKKMILTHFMSSVDYVMNFAEKSVSRTGRTWMWTLVPTGQISTLISFLLFSYIIKVSFLTWFLPLALLLVSVFIMTVSTIRLLRGKKRFAEFTAWGEFLDAVSAKEEKTIDTKKAKENYVLNHMSPFVHFSLATACCVMGFGTSDKSWVLTSELSILSLLMYGTFAYVFDFAAPARNVLICQICSSIVRGFQCPDAGKVFGVLVSIPFPFIGASFHVSPSSILRIIMIFQILKLALSNNRDCKMSVHIITKVVPVIVAVVWWDVGELFLSYCSVISVARASLEYLSLLFAMPLFAVFLCYTLTAWLFSMELTKIGITLAVVVIPSVCFVVWKNRSYCLKKLEAILEKSSMKTVVILVGFIILGYIMVYYRPSGLKVPQSGLSWQDYKKLCSDSKSPAVGNNIAIAATCYEFKGYGVTWKGEVESVDVTKIENKMDDLLNLLPKGIATWFSCRYGSPYPSPEICSKSDQLTPMVTMQCAMASTTARRCSIQNHNLYDFRVTVKMPQNDDSGKNHFMYLDVTNDFRYLLFELKKGMPIQFTGVLTGVKDSLSARVLSTSTEDDNVIKAEKRVKRIERTLEDMFDDALIALHNFILYPVVSFADDDN